MVVCARRTCACHMHMSTCQRSAREVCYQKIDTCPRPPLGVSRPPSAYALRYTDYRVLISRKIRGVEHGQVTLFALRSKH